MREQNKTEPASEPGKWWAHSLTIWGTLLTAATTVVPVLGPAFGITVSAEVIRQLGDQTGLAVQAIGGVVGTVMAIYGRSRADTRLARRELRMHL